MTKQTKSGLITLIIIITVIIAVLVGTSIVQSGKGKEHVNIQNVPVTENAKNNTTDETFIPHFGKYNRNSFIAAVYIEGIIEDENYDYDQEWLLSTINNLKVNQKNVALALYIDSPGGGVYQADEVYLALQDYKTTGKPVYVYQGPMAASGGYYISCAGDKIYANRNTLTGCIGVIFGQSIDITGLLDKAGIKTKTFHSGRNKTMLNPDEPLTEEQEEIMQSMCDECYNQFVNIVANSRNMTYTKAADLSDGRLYTAKQGLENGLVDAIDSWENMLENLAEDELGMPGIKVATFKKEKETSILEKLIMSVTKLQNQEAAAKLGLPPSVLEQINNFNSYPAYLYTGF